MRTLMLTIMALIILSSAAWADTSYYPNGAVLQRGDTIYYPSGRYACHGSTIYYESGRYLKSGDTYYYADGRYIKHGDTVCYNNGMYLKSGDTYYYENGRYACSGGRCYYQNGSSAGDGPITLKESLGTGDGFLIVKINSRYVRELIVVCLGRGIYMEIDMETGDVELTHF